MNAQTSFSSPKYISRGGDKLAAALDGFGIPVDGLTCADFGSHVGGFVDCLLQHGATKVYSIDTSYGTLGWKLRKDPRVVVMERTNAMHVELPEQVDLVTADVGWTPQRHVLPSVRRAVKASGAVISLIKPHYEAPGLLIEGVLPDAALNGVLETALSSAHVCQFRVAGLMPSPVRGHGGNREFLVHLLPVQGDAIGALDDLRGTVAAALRSANITPH